MSNIKLLNASCADQTVDAVVNAANGGLWAGGGMEHPPESSGVEDVLKR